MVNSEFHSLLRICQTFIRMISEFHSPDIAMFSEFHSGQFGIPLPSLSEFHSGKERLNPLLQWFCCKTKRVLKLTKILYLKGIVSK